MQHKETHLQSSLSISSRGDLIEQGRTSWHGFDALSTHIYRINSTVIREERTDVPMNVMEMERSTASKSITTTYGRLNQMTVYCALTNGWLRHIIETSAFLTKHTECKGLWKAVKGCNCCKLSLSVQTIAVSTCRLIFHNNASLAQKL